MPFWLIACFFVGAVGFASVLLLALCIAGAQSDRASGAREWAEAAELPEPPVEEWAAELARKRAHR